MSELLGQVALITGGARGMGRSHAVALAEAGADIVIVDRPEAGSTDPVPTASESDMEQTRRLVEAQGRRCLALHADVRDVVQLTEAADRAVAELGRIDILVANAGILTHAPVAEMSAEMWQNTVDVNLTGVFNSFRAVLPHMIAAGYGRIVAIASGGAKSGTANLAHYCATKWGVVGLVKSVALETIDNGITVNAICPINVNTSMIRNDYMKDFFLKGAEGATPQQVESHYVINPMGVPWLEPSDVSRVVRFVVHPDSKYMTGETFGPMAGAGALNGAA